MGNQRKYLVIESWVCPTKGCTYVVAPGLAPAQGPPMAVPTESSDRHGVVRRRLNLFCPTHSVGLVKSSTKQRIEPYKGTPRVGKFTFEKKPNLPKLMTGGRQ